MDTHFHFYHSASGGGRGRAWILRSAAALAVLAAGLAAWYAFHPVSLARILGKIRGGGLTVERLELEVDGRTVSVGPDGTTEIAPAGRIRYRGFASSRWLNYDLEASSPDFDLGLVAAAPRSLLSLLGGEEAFREPRTVTIQIKEKGETRAVFRIHSAFSSADWARMADAASDPDRRIELYRRALSLAPGEQTLRDSLAAALLADGGRRAELAELLEGFLAEDPEGPGAGGLLARLLAAYRDLGDKGEEARTLERLLALAERGGGDTAPYRRALALLYLSSEPARAAVLYEGLLEGATPEERLRILTLLAGIYREAGPPAKAVETYERLLPLVVPEQAPWIWSELVRLHEESGDARAIDRSWEGLARALPEEGGRKADAWRHLGALRAGREELEGAVAAFRAASDLSPDDPSLYRALAALARRRGDQEALRENLEKALALGPDPELKRELALAYARGGMRDRALALWRELADAPPGAPAEDEIRADARARLLDLLRPPEGEASAEFEETLYRYSVNGVEFYNLGVGHFKGRRWDAAEKAFLRALELQTPSVEADCRGYLMALYREKKDTPAMLAQAEALYRADTSRREHRDLMAAELEVGKSWEALEKAALGWTAADPSDPDNWRYLALAQRNLKRPDAEVARSLLHAARAEPGSVPSWLAAAEALEKAGDPQASRGAYEKVLELDEKNDKAGQALLRLNLDRLSPSGSVRGGAASLGGGNVPAGGGAPPGRQGGPGGTGQAGQGETR